MVVGKLTDVGDDTPEEAQAEVQKNVTKEVDEEEKTDVGPLYMQGWNQGSNNGPTPVRTS